MADEIKRIDISEFRDLGFLQEANRQFFHPLGLALEIEIDDETGEARLGGIWDYRDDPEGICYAERPDRAKAERVSAERRKHFVTRAQMFAGDTVQPLGWYPPAGTDD